MLDGVLDVRAVEDFDNLVALCNELQHIFDCGPLILAAYPLLVLVQHPHSIMGLSQAYDSASIKQALVSNPMAG